MSFLASVGCAGPSLLTAEAVKEERANHLNVNFHFYLSKRRKIPCWGMLSIAQQLNMTILWKQLKAIIPALRNDGEIRYSYKHWSQRGPGDLGTQKSSEEGLEGQAMVFCSLNAHTF